MIFQLTPFKHIVTITLWFVVSYSLLLSQSTLHVPEDYSSIQQALDAAVEGTTIKVQPGTYYEHLIWPSAIDGIVLQSVNGSEQTIIDGTNDGRVVLINGENLTSLTILDGFTLQNGGGSNNQSGIALATGSSSPTLNNLIIRDNHCNQDTDSGCAVRLSNYNGNVSNCTFINNTIDAESTAFGAALYLSPQETVNLDNCRFENNHSKSNNESFGGAVMIKPSWGSTQNDEVHISNSTFENNSTQGAPYSMGGAIYFDDYYQSMKVSIKSCVFNGNTTNLAGYGWGGAIHSRSIELEIDKSTFTENVAKAGSAVYVGDKHNNSTGNLKFSNLQLTNNSGLANEYESSSVILSGTSFGDATFENCQFDHNIVNHTIRSSSSEDSSNLLITNSTLAYNSGSLYLAGNNVSLINTILWNTSANEIKTVLHSPLTGLDIESCVIKGGAQGTNIIDANPLFKSEDLLIPSDGSPCLGYGTHILATENDIRGKPRPMPEGSYPDIGAYEVDQYFANVKAKFFYDTDENGYKDETEPYISVGSLVVNNNLVVSNFREEGVFIVLEQGVNVLEYSNIGTQDWNTNSTTLYEFDVNTDDFQETIEFGLYPRLHNSALSAFVEGGAFRCGEEVQMNYHIKNFGTEIESGISWLKLDSRIENYSFEIEPDTIRSSHEVGWFFEELYPYKSLDFAFIVRVPLIESEDQLGEIYTFKSWKNNQDPRLAFCYDTELRCSFDPNDKAVSPNRTDSLALLDDYLLYKIRFQNTGNDYARNVSVYDTIDANLDLSSFQLLSTSHLDVLQVIKQENQIEFRFRNIYLPDSLTNLVGSNGHITYLIKPVEGLEEMTMIKNTAHINFDFNPAIVTNTTATTLVEYFPEHNTTQETKKLINVFPNPVDSYLKFDKNVDLGRLYDRSGKLVMTFRKKSTIDVSSFVEGIYYLELSEKGELSKQLIAIAR